jgi:hypothetical protein
MRMDEIEWRYQGNSVRVGMTWHGQGEFAYVASPQFNFDSNGDVAAAGAPGIVLHNVGHRLGGIW